MDFLEKLQALEIEYLNVVIETLEQQVTVIDQSEITFRQIGSVMDIQFTGSCFYLMVRFANVQATYKLEQLGKVDTVH